MTCVIYTGKRPPRKAMGQIREMIELPLRHPTLPLGLNKWL